MPLAELYWFPFFCKDWLSSPARAAMLPEQRGAYIDLLAYAWGNGDDPPCLPSDDATLAGMSGLGARWKKLGALIRSQFAEVDGSLFNAKLTEVWNEQQAKHTTAVERGRNGGRVKAAKRKLLSSPTRVEGVDSAYQSEPEEAVEAPIGLLPASAPVGALALEGARAPALLNDGTHRPWVASESIPPGQDALEAEYFSRLATRADAWAVENPDDAVALETELRTEMGLPHHRDLSTFEKGAYRDRFLDAVRERKKWPASEEWIRLERARQAFHPTGNGDRAANDHSEAADD